MNTHPISSRGQRGFALVAVLLLVGLITAVASTYSRHVLVQNKSSSVYRPLVGARETCHSGVQYARQVLHTGEGALSCQIDGLATPVQVAVGDLPDDHDTILVRADAGEGLGATELVELARLPEVVASGPDDLPRLDKETIDAILADDTIEKHHFSGSVRLEDTTLEGLVVIHESTGLFLDDVIIRGLVVSEDVLTDEHFGPYNSCTVPCAVLDGDTKIEPGDFFPGAAVIMPDGVLTTRNDGGRVQIGGRVVAHRVNLDWPGAVRGSIAAVAPVQLHPEMDVVGYGRGVEEWPEGFTAGDSYQTRFLAFLPRVTTLAEMDPVVGFWADGD